MSKRQAIRKKRIQQQRRQRLVIIAMMVVGALLVTAALIYPSIKPVGEIVSITPRTFNTQVDGRTLGDPNAPVIVDVWEDFQCPACVNYSLQIESLLITNYVETGKIVYTFHHYPFIDSMVSTNESHQAANASMCAGDQGRFWDFHDILIANWNGENQGAFSDKRLVAFAEDLGLEMSSFNTCFNQDKFADQISQDFADGQAMGVSGTPSVFINGVQITPGFVPSYEQLSSIIDAALAGE
ncbi:DsbA family protein [Chloroflexota bacterium]